MESREQSREILLEIHRPETITAGSVDGQELVAENAPKVDGSVALYDSLPYYIQANISPEEFAATLEREPR